MGDPQRRLDSDLSEGLSASKNASANQLPRPRHLRILNPIDATGCGFADIADAQHYSDS